MRAASALSSATVKDACETKQQYYCVCMPVVQWLQAMYTDGGVNLEGGIDQFDVGMNSGTCTLLW